MRDSMTGRGWGREGKGRGEKVGRKEGIGVLMSRAVSEWACLFSRL